MAGIKFCKDYWREGIVSFMSYLLFFKTLKRILIIKIKNISLFPATLLYLFSISSDSFKIQSSCLKMKYSASIVIRKPAFQQLWGALLISCHFTHAYACITCSDACIFSCMLFPPGDISFLAGMIILSKKVFFQIM